MIALQEKQTDALEEARLFSLLSGLGMNFSTPPEYTKNTEETVFRASLYAIQNQDYRTLSVLVLWLQTYGGLLSFRVLLRLSKRTHPVVLAFWEAIQFLFLKKKKNYTFKTKGRYRLDPFLSDFLLRRQGEDPRFARSPLLLPQGMLREREADILPYREAWQHPFLRKNLQRADAEIQPKDPQKERDFCLRESPDFYEEKEQDRFLFPVLSLLCPFSGIPASGVEGLDLLVHRQPSTREQSLLSSSGRPCLLQFEGDRTVWIALPPKEESGSSSFRCFPLKRTLPPQETGSRFLLLFAEGKRQERASPIAVGDPTKMAVATFLSKERDTFLFQKKNGQRFALNEASIISAYAIYAV